MKQFFTFFAAVVLLVGFTPTVLAYDFSAVAPSGQTLYYNIVDGNAQVTHENNYIPTYPDLTGSFSIPSTVIYDGTTYSVTSIGESAFHSCTGLTSITIPNSVTSIGNMAFYRCSGLTSVTIGNSVTSIGSDAFYNCTGLTSVYYTGDIAGWCGIEFGGDYANPLGYAHDLYINNILVTGLVIPSSVTTIRDFAFYNCTGLTSVTIPNTVTSIGSYAFYCTGLCNLDVPSSVTTIGSGAFYGIKNVSYNGSAGGRTWGANLINGYVDGYLTYRNATRTYLIGCCTSAEGAITIPSTVDTIGLAAFSGCTGLTSVTIPNSVTSIGDYAFTSCTGLTSVYYTGDIAGWCGIEFGYNANPLVHAHNLYINNTLVTDLVIPSSVTSIGNYAFRGCTGLTSVTIPNSVTSIGNSAFSGCTGLTKIYSLNTTPPTLNINYVWESVPIDIPVYVPCGRLSAYQSAWRYFSNFVEIVFSVEVSTSNQQMGSAEVTVPYSCGTSQSTVSASPNSGYLFDHWSDGSTDNPYQLTVISDTSLTAYFIQAHTVTAISDNDAMGSTSGNGIYPENSEASITATANYGYHFDHWNDGNTDNPRVVTVTGDITFTAYFAPNQYTVTVYTYYNDRGSVSGGGTRNYLDTTVISATANYGYHFVEWWSDLDFSEENPHIVTVTGDDEYEAYFEPNQYTITVSSDNDNQGTVSGEGSFDYLSERSITATANYGYHFTHWNDGNTDNPRTITLTEDVSFTALFDFNQYTLTLQSNDASLGTVDGGGTYNYLDTVTITATAVPHYHFVRWSDYNTSNPRQYVITGNKTLTATFTIDVHTVAVSVDDISHGSVQASGTTFNYGSPCTVTATAYSGYTFSSWSNGMTDNPYTFAVLNDVDLIAYFVPTGSQPTTYFTITAVSADPSMGSVTGGGSYASGTTATLTASANSGYHFTHWQDNVTSNPRTITVTGNATYTAYFESDGGGEQPSDNAPSIACVGVDMNGRNVVRWEPRQGVAVVRYNIYREGLGGYSQVGYVNATNGTEYSWVDDNSNTATQAYSYKISEVSANGTESDLSLPHTTMHLQISQGQGTTWNLSWTPYVGFNYSGYRIYRGTSSANMSLLTELSSSATTYSDNAPSGDVYYQIEVVASGAKSITASSRSNIATSVQNQQFTITVLSDNNSMGTVSGGGTFAQGATATISATPLSGYTFTQWSDGSTQAQRTITVTSNATYTAYFAAGGSEPQQYLITVVSNNPDRGTVTGGGLYDAGAVITITAEPFAGHEFVKWQDGNTEDFRTITVTADATYTAYFRTATEGINDVEAADNIKIYSHGNRIVIDFSGQTAAVGRQSVVVYDVMGRVIKQTADSGQQAVVEIPVTSAGVYMVKVGEWPSRKVLVRQ